MNLLDIIIKVKIWKKRISLAYQKLNSLTNKNLTFLYLYYILNIGIFGLLGIFCAYIDILLDPFLIPYKNSFFEAYLDFMLNLVFLLSILRYYILLNAIEYDTNIHEFMQFLLILAGIWLVYQLYKYFKHKK